MKALSVNPAISRQFQVKKAGLVILLDEFVGNNYFDGN